MFLFSSLFPSKSLQKNNTQKNNTQKTTCLNNHRFKYFKHKQTTNIMAQSRQNPSRGKKGPRANRQRIPDPDTVEDQDIQQQDKHTDEEIIEETQEDDDFTLNFDMGALEDLSSGKPQDEEELFIERNLMTQFKNMFDQFRQNNLKRQRDTESVLREKFAKRFKEMETKNQKLKEKMDREAQSYVEMKYKCENLEYKVLQSGKKVKQLMAHVRKFSVQVDGTIHDICPELIDLSED